MKARLFARKPIHDLVTFAIFQLKISAAGGRQGIMNKSTITIDVKTDESRVPESITWNATDSGAENAQKAKAMMISFWDGAEKTALRIDLWTKDNDGG